MTPLENHFTYGFGLFFSYLLILLYNISKIAQILFSLVGPLNTYCSSIYTAQLWSKYTQTSINKLYTAYHNILKSFIGVSKREYTSPICVNLNVKNCPAVIRNLVYKFMNRLHTSHNVIIKAICNSSCFYESQIWRHWRSLLYIR